MANGGGAMRRHAYGCGLEAALDVVGGKWKPVGFAEQMPKTDHLFIRPPAVPGFIHHVYICNVLGGNGQFFGRKHPA
jgi:hypothetical protein